MIAYARALWNSEIEHNARLATRGRTIVAATSTLLGLVTLILVIANPAGVLGMLNTDHHPITIWLVCAFACGSLFLVLGLINCISAIVAFLRHDHEEWGVMDSVPDFSVLCKDWCTLQPNAHSVALVYLMEMGLHQSHPGQAYGRLLRFSRRWKVFEVLWPKRPIKRAFSFFCYSLFGGTWPRLWWASRDKARRDAIEKMVRGWIGPTPKWPHHEMFMVNSSFYLQLAKGFMLWHVGRYETEKPATYTRTTADGATVLESHPFVPMKLPQSDRPSIQSFTDSTWRIFTSLYFAAQQQRSANWNLWCRVKLTERLFTQGVVLIVFSFVFATFVASLANFVNQPVTRVQLADPQGAAFGVTPSAETQRK